MNLDQRRKHSSWTGGRTASSSNTCMSQRRARPDNGNGCSTATRDKTYQVVPRWALSRRPVSTATVIAARDRRSASRRGHGVWSCSPAIWCAARLADPPARRLDRVVGAVPPQSDRVLCGADRRRVGLALGPPYGLWQFVYWLPGFNLIRGSSRFMVVGTPGFRGAGRDRFRHRSARRLAPPAAWPWRRCSASCWSRSTRRCRWGFEPSKFEIPGDRSLARQPAEAVRGRRSAGARHPELGERSSGRKPRT